MTACQPDIDELARERQSIARHGSLHWLHWTVVVLSLVITFGAWYFVKHEAQEKTRIQFENAAEQVVQLASERMQKYEDGLWGGVAAIQAQGGDIGYEEWRQFAQSLQIETKYPGINGIGVIHQVPPEQLETYLLDQRRSRPHYHLHPAHDKSVYLPITYIEPSSENAKAVGLDMAHEANRFGAALKARDTGKAQITGPIVLVQDAGKTPGFLFYAPFYAGGPYDSLEQRRDHFVGMVYAPFVFHKLIEGVLGKDRRQVRLSVKDGTNVLYNEHAELDQETDSNPLFETVVDVDLYGRTWTFDIVSTNSFREASTNSQPMMILIGGITIDSLLLTLFILLSRANRRAVDFADRVANQLRSTNLEHVRLIEEDAKKEQRLIIERAEAESLEKELRQEREKGLLQRKFVAMVSHEFRTPLAIIDGNANRAMRSQDEQAPPDHIVKTQTKIRNAVRRLIELIDQVLASSKLEAGTIEFKPALFNLSELIEDACTQLDEISPNHTIIRDLSATSGELFFGDQKLLRQVVTNLLSNAVKYSPDGRRVEIICKKIDGVVSLDVRDYGLGVPEDEIPKLFTHCFRASTSEGIAGTGIGLNLVEAFTKLHGGEVFVQSRVGDGSTFTLRLPIASADAPAAMHEAVA